MPEITLSELRYVLFEWNQKHGKRSGPTDQKYIMAMSVLASMLDIQWLDNKIDNHDSTNAYIRPKPSSPIDNHRHADRVIQLGERLFNLQAVRGIRFPLDELKTKNIESTFAVFAAAEMLFKARVPFEFVERRHQKGQDYDIRIFTADGAEVGCEVKCKTETTVYSESTLRSSLKTARQQLPRGKPGLIIIMVPEKWLIDDTIRHAWPRVLKSIYRNTSRIAAVLLFGEHWNFSADGSAERFGRYIHWSNEKSLLPDTLTGFSSERGK
ncbi:MAG TPA: hypothetical protein VKP65_20710, partial [Rhodothermales bacterium]|nr:hypothetical protein [Rhodothermales bacterium]